MILDHYPEYWSLNPLYTWCIHWLSNLSDIFYFWPRWPNFGLMVMSQLMVVEHYLNYWSFNPLYISFIQWSVESSERTRFLATLVEFWRSGGQKNGRNLVVSDHYLEYWPLNPLHTYWWGESSEFIQFFYHGQILVLLVAEKMAAICGLREWRSYY